VANPIDESLTGPSHGVVYRGDRETSSELEAERLATEEKLKACLGWDTIRWAYEDYDGEEI